MESKSHCDWQIEAHRQQLVLTEGRAGQPCRHGGDPGNEMRSCVIMWSSGAEPKHGGDDQRVSGQEAALKQSCFRHVQRDDKTWWCHSRSDCVRVTGTSGFHLSEIWLVDFQWDENLTSKLVDQVFLTGETEKLRRVLCARPITAQWWLQSKPAVLLVLWK